MFLLFWALGHEQGAGLEAAIFANSSHTTTTTTTMILRTQRVRPIKINAHSPYLNK